MRLIDADMLKGAFEMDGYKSPYVERLIDACPTVDAVPVVHGEWVNEINPHAVTASGKEVHVWRCSACGFTWANRHDVLHYFKHCPSCGAKMDGGAKK